MSSAFQFGTHNFSRHQKSHTSLCGDFTEKLEQVLNFIMFLSTYLWIWIFLSRHVNFLGSRDSRGPIWIPLNPFSSKLIIYTPRGGLWTFSANIALCVAFQEKISFWEKWVTWFIWQLKNSKHMVTPPLSAVLSISSISSSLSFSGRLERIKRISLTAMPPVRSLSNTWNGNNFGIIVKAVEIK